MNTVPNRLKVLVVDDEKWIADSLVMILKHNGYDATAVYSGEDSVNAAAVLAPDVVISDVIMGGMNGVAAAITIRKTLPKCEVLLVSGAHATEKLLEQAQAAGHLFEALAKPVHPQALLERLRLVQSPAEPGPGPA